ncbi:hypothetical protein C8R47DRAFT_1132840 [Mycena vitilis]|nr:hypothetical protein C8R47DRAFT_1132840 [Mycena vitilis]
MHKYPYCFPIIGGRKIEHLLSSIEALDISLSNAQITDLESIIPFDSGFSNTMIGDGREHTFLMNMAAVFVKQHLAKTIRPSKD